MYIIPEKLRDKYKHTVWTGRGNCDQYNDRGMVQQYALDFEGMWPGLKEEFHVINGLSCLNGWAFGNLAASAHDIAMFFWDFGGTNDILSDETRHLMTSDLESTTVYFPITYGLGLVPYAFGVLPGEDEDFNLRVCFGHPGEDWGSNAKYACHAPHYNFSIAVTMTSNMGMNCSTPGHEWI